MEQGTPIFSHVVFQDNTSCMGIQEATTGPAQRTKHLNIRFLFAGQKAREGEIVLVHKSTKEMIADMLTKPLAAETFFYLRDRLCGK
jgi:hypothetical protein